MHSATRTERSAALVGSPVVKIIRRFPAGLIRAGLVWASLIWLLAFLVGFPAPPDASAASPGDLSALREQALELVNAARREHGLLPLKLSERLNTAAQAHAEDMLARGYYSHVSPEGEDMLARYSALGGDRSRLVAENIDRCVPCAATLDAALIGKLMQRWMEGPQHRDNILRRGLTRFGFGFVSGENGPTYAVQTFAGPGTSRSTDSRQASEPLTPAEAGEIFARRANARREEASLPPLELSPVLSTLAATLLPPSASGDMSLEPEGGLMSALPPQSRGDWQSLSVLAGSCGSCGSEPTTADIRYFLQMWLDDSQRADQLTGREPTALGFAVRAYGGGRKVAVAVLGTRR